MGLLGSWLIIKTKVILSGRLKTVNGKYAEKIVTGTFFSIKNIKKSACHYFYHEQNV